jgi:hypothetical protein
MRLTANLNAPAKVVEIVQSVAASQQKKFLETRDFATSTVCGERVAVFFRSQLATIRRLGRIAS